MSLPNNFFPALGYEASAKETFFGFIAYKTLYLGKTDKEFGVHILELGIQG
jgi:hypothetical protein